MTIPATSTPPNTLRVQQIKVSELHDGSTDEGEAVKFAMFKEDVREHEYPPFFPNNLVDPPEINSQGDILYKFNGDCTLLRRPPEGYQFIEHQGSLSEDPEQLYDSWIVRETQ